MAVSFIKGVQSKGVGTSLKHFAANNQEYQRSTINSEVDERTLREIYLPAFEAVRGRKLKTARAWAMKETAMQIWGYVRKGWAYKFLMRWISWAMHSKLEPMKKVARMFRKHMWGIINAIIEKANN